MMRPSLVVVVVEAEDMVIAAVKTVKIDASRIFDGGEVEGWVEGKTQKVP